MESDVCQRLQRVSRALTGHNCVLPTAAILLECSDDAPVTVPEIVKGLMGELPANRVAEALQRLKNLGAIRELPYPGRPHPRMFERIDGPFWSFVRDWALDEATDCSTAS